MSDIYLRTCVEYLDDIHTYLINGIIVPSVSELCRFATGKTYEGVPKNILNAKAEYGTKMHSMIERYENGEEVTSDNSYLKASFNEYLEIRSEHLKEPVCEKIVAYKDLYAGRIDILDGTNLVDIKTTYKLEVDWLQWQLGYYKLALQDMAHSIKRCYCLWLPKGHAGQWVNIIPKEPSELLRNYKEWADAR